MFTTTKIGATTLFILSASKDVLGLPLLQTRQNASIGNFGSCSVPQIEFGVGFDNRKETSFQPTDKTSFNHGSAQNIDIITQFICDTLTNSCNADATAKATCASAQKAADTQTAKTGAQADAFNAVFGIQTNFAAVPVVNDQGVTLGVDGASSAASGATAAAGSNNQAAATTAAPASAQTDAASGSDCTATVTVTVPADAAATGSASSGAADNAASSGSAASGSASSSIGNFGSCSVPQIEFGAGFDGRKETAFQPTDKTSFNHGSAQNIGVITQFICDTLTNTCGADATAKATCASAQTAANGATAKTGAQADAFNAVFGIQTNFAAVAVVDDTGKTISAGSATQAAGSNNAAAATTTASTSTSTGSASTSAGASGNAASSGIGNFGSCSVPQIEFGVGFDNRKETSFQPTDKTSFNHGSAQNIDIITQFICDTLTNSCNADATAKATCASAQKAADGQTAKTGAQADAFNAVFGIQTNFAAVPVVNDQGVTQAAAAAGAAPTA